MAENEIESELSFPLANESPFFIDLIWVIFDADILSNDLVPFYYRLI